MGRIRHRGRHSRSFMSVLVLALVIVLGTVVSGCTVEGCGCAFVSCTLPGEQEAAQREFDRMQAASERIDSAAQTMPINPAPFPSAAPLRYDIPVGTSCYDPSTGLLSSSQLDSRAYVAPHWVAFSTMISGRPDQNALEICLPDADGGADTAPGSTSR